ncbi:MAG: tRNA (adenosine(37)-N6)-threonylcarbamoyltransferase complex dimerization subunit type 1 TsaB [Bacteroidales bacterium]|nr:tRNA (adenosine(37)-N6)-threonylcarbamoyltransferase complex dimerization subunit type 1 TsaB [Bacteroidales bacterium]
MALILNIETATHVCSVGLSKDGKTIALKESIEEKSHAASLTVFIEKILHAQKLSIQNLDAICVSKGPGSYTGLRIGVSTAKGLCYGSDKPLLSVITFQNMCMAAKESPAIHKLTGNFSEEVLLCPMIDARRMEVFTALYDWNLNKVSDIEAKIIDEKSFEKTLHKKQILFFGNGADKCRPYLNHPNAGFLGNINPSAQYMSAIAESLFQRRSFEDVAYFEPFYLKDFIPTVPKKNILR